MTRRRAGSDFDANEALKPVDPEVEMVLSENRDAFLHFLTRRLGDKNDAEDVLQDFYLKALSKGHGIRKSESIVAWLYRVLRSALADQYRSRQRRTRHEAAYAAEQAILTEARDAELHAMVCECLYRLLPTLQADYAEVLWRIDLIGESRSNVARALGMTMNNLAVRLHRARQALKRALLKSCESCPEHGFFDCHCDLPIRSISSSTSA